MNTHFYLTNTPLQPLTADAIAGRDDAIARTHRLKLYRLSGTELVYSAIAAPLDDAGIGSGLEDLRNQEALIGAGQALAAYFGQLVVFGERGVQFWVMDTDPDQNQYLRTIRNVGLLGPRTVVEYADGDVVFLANSGVRSLRARDSSNQARVEDLGSAIDDVLRPILRQASTTNSPVPRAVARIVPSTGDLWVAIGSTIYVLSRRPAANVLAWSTYELGSPTSQASDGWIEDMAEVNGTLMVRNRARQVFVYGGPLLDQYDDTAAVIETPYLSAGTPGTNKLLSGIDIAATGTWRVAISTNPDNPIYEPVAEITGSSHRMARLPVQAYAQHFSIQCTSLGEGPAKIAEILVHYQTGQSE